MKKALATIAIGLTTAASSLAGPSWGFQLGNGAGFFWNGGGQQTMPRRHYHNYYQPQVYVQGPSYYRVGGIPCHARVLNYTDAPLVIQHRRGSRVVPATW